MLCLEQVPSATRQGLARRGARGNANSKANKPKAMRTHSEHKRPSIPGRLARQAAVNSTHERKSPQPYEPIVTKSMFLLCNQQPRHKDDVCPTRFSTSLRLPPMHSRLHRAGQWCTCPTVGGKHLPSKKRASMRWYLQHHARLHMSNRCTIAMSAWRQKNL